MFVTFLIWSIWHASTVNLSINVNKSVIYYIYFYAQQLHSCAVILHNLDLFCVFCFCFRNLFFYVLNDDTPIKKNIKCFIHVYELHALCIKNTNYE